MASTEFAGSFRRQHAVIALVFLGWLRALTAGFDSLCPTFSRSRAFPGRDRINTSPPSLRASEQTDQLTKVQSLEQTTKTPATACPLVLLNPDGSFPGNGEGTSLIHEIKLFLNSGYSTHHI
jgi:hypothetical protein